MVALGFGKERIQIKPSWIFDSGSLVSLDVRYIEPMPRLPDSFLRQVVFLYPSVPDAEGHVRLGGTGFIAGKRAHLRGSTTPDGDEYYVPYIVSNRHVVYDAGSSVVRLNRRDGGVAIIGLEPTDWEVHPDREDLAAVCAFNYLDTAIHEVSMVGAEDFVTEQIIQDNEIGIGEEVFMLGRFLNHQGEKLNRPAIRFGSISMMLEPIPNDILNTKKPSFAVEMRSRTGFSGSPVHVYRDFTTIVDKQFSSEPFHYLLGVNWGHINDEHGENTWLNGVVPAWKILDMLESPKLLAQHKEAEERMLHIIEGRFESGVQPAVESDTPTTDENPRHKEDFNSLLDAAAKGTRPDGQT